MRQQHHHQLRGASRSIRAEAQRLPQPDSLHLLHQKRRDEPQNAHAAISLAEGLCQRHKQPALRNHQHIRQPLRRPQLTRRPQPQQHRKHQRRQHQHLQRTAQPHPPHHAPGTQPREADEIQPRRARLCLHHQPHPQRHHQAAQQRRHRQPERPRLSQGTRVHIQRQQHQHHQRRHQILRRAQQLPHIAHQHRRQPIR